MKDATFKTLCKDVKERIDEKVTDTIIEFHDRMYIDTGDCHFELEIMLDNAVEQVAKLIATILVSQREGDE